MLCGFAKTDLRKKRKNLPRNSSPWSAELIFLCMWFASFHLKVLICFNSLLRINTEVNQSVSLDFKEFDILHGKGRMFHHKEDYGGDVDGYIENNFILPVRGKQMTLQLRGTGILHGHCKQTKCTLTTGLKITCEVCVCSLQSSALSRKQYLRCYFSRARALRSLLVVKIVWIILLLRDPLSAWSFTVYWVDGLSSARL